MSSPAQQKESIDQKDELFEGIPSGLGGKKDDAVDSAEGPKGGDIETPGNNEATSTTTQDVEVPSEDVEASGATIEEELLITGLGSKEKEAEDTETPSELEALPSQDPMESSTATLKPSKPSPKNQLPPAHEVPNRHLSVNESVYRDPTPKTPASSQPPSRTPSNATSIPLDVKTLDAPERSLSPTRSDAGFDERPSDDERDLSSKSEIQSIMEQFSGEGQGPGHEEVMSPRLEVAGPLLGSPIQHPPRKSSLEPLDSNAAPGVKDLRLPSSHASSDQVVFDPADIGPTVPPKPGSIRSFVPQRTGDSQLGTSDTPLSPPLHRPPPPEPEPEPDLPFDFHRFLEQLRHRTADPVAKFLRSFLQEFGKKQWMVHEQVKIIGDFLAFITNKMAQCEVWREVSDAEFDNAREGMEKLVMNRLYTQTFSPAIPPPQPIPGGKPRRRGTERLMGPGRRGQHQEDVERDDILAQKVSIYGWIREEHLDIQPVADSGAKFLKLAQAELKKIKTYRAPRDKIICVLNCCKVIFGLLKHSKSDGSADSFMPLLIYVVLQANPEHLVSNVQYILRFRNQEKLGGEAGYYLSSLMGAVQFIENLDRTTLTISDEDFEKNVEAAVSAIAEKHQAEAPEAPPKAKVPEKSTLSRPEVTPRHSMKRESSTPRKSTSSNEYSGDDEKAAMSGLLKTIQRPITTIGRIFAEEGSSSQSGPATTPLPGNANRISSTPTPPRVSSDTSRGLPQPPTQSREQAARNQMTAEDAAARQASAELAEAHRIQRLEHANVVETLAGMFPDLDREIISDVVTQKEGRVGLAVDACLALSS